MPLVYFATLLDLEDKFIIVKKFLVNNLRIASYMSNQMFIMIQHYL